MSKSLCSSTNFRTEFQVAGLGQCLEFCQPYTVLSPLANSTPARFFFPTHSSHKVDILMGWSVGFGGADDRYLLPCILRGRE